MLSVSEGKLIFDGPRLASKGGTRTWGTLHRRGILCWCAINVCERLVVMGNAHVDLTDLTAREASLEQSIEGYRASLSTVTGACSKSSMRRQLEECEMALEQVLSELGEI